MQAQFIMKITTLVSAHSISNYFIYNSDNLFATARQQLTLIVKNMDRADLICTFMMAAMSYHYGMHWFCSIHQLQLKVVASLI